jgi:hypothetical protein
MFIIGVPRITSALQSDSGFLECYRPIKTMTEKFGCVGLIILPTTKKLQREASIIHSMSTDKLLVAAIRTHNYHDLAKMGPSPDIVESISGSTAKSFCNCLFTSSQMFLSGARIRSVDPVVHLSKKFNSPLSIITDVLYTGGLDDDDILGLICADKVLFSTQREHNNGAKLLRRMFSGTVVSEAIQNKLTVLCDGVSPVPHALSREEIIHRLTVKPASKILGLVGRLSASNKRWEMVVGVYNTLRKFGYPIHVITGLSDRLANNCTKELFKNDLSGVTVFADNGKDKWVKERLPTLCAMMYASKDEGYCTTTVESVSYGIPLLVPSLPWATAIYGDDYPFIYSDVEQARVMLLKIMQGKVSLDVAEKFADQSISLRKYDENYMHSELHRIMFDVYKQKELELGISWVSRPMVDMLLKNFDNKVICECELDKMLIWAGIDLAKDTITARAIPSSWARLRTLACVSEPVGIRLLPNSNYRYGFVPDVQRRIDKKRAIEILNNVHRLGWI